jgi:hypothetical protein
MLKRLLPTAAALLLTGALAGCDGTGPERPGSFSIMLTDAPGDFARAVVTIDHVYLQGSGGDADPPGGRITLMDTPVTVDLLELRNEVMALVEDVTVPGGTYGQLRLVISGGFIEVIDAEDADGNPAQTRIYASSPAYAAAQGVTADGSLQMPSFAQSGLKLNLPGGAARVDGDQTILLLDFNVAESFGQQAGASGQWVMMPVIHVSDFALTGSVRFDLSLGEGVELPEVEGEQLTLADFQATLDRDGDLITESFEAANGTHRVTFGFLPPRGAAYPVELLVPAGITVTLEPAFPAGVTITSGALQEHAFVITAVELEE